MELYKKHRPELLKHIEGQADAVRMVKSMLDNGKIPHAILLTGPSGCGKTTIARILKTKLGCDDLDFHEVNCADFRGIDMVREMRSGKDRHPHGKCRVWLIDEVHAATKDFQNAFLKILEDTPDHLYFFLCTTDPGKLLKTIVTRCTEIKLKALHPKSVAKLVTDIAGREKKQLGTDVVDKIVEVAEGSARKALVLLNQIMDIESEEEMIECVQSSDSKKEAIEIARILMNPRATWGELAKVLKEVEEDPERLRHMILGYATTVLLGGGKLAPRAFTMIQFFRDHFYDSKRAGLVASCYEMLHAK